MNLLRDRANNRPSGTKMASAAQGVVLLATVALGVANRRLDLGIPEAELALYAGALVGLLQAAANWYQRRATERVDDRLKRGPRG